MATVRRLALLAVVALLAESDARAAEHPCSLQHLNKGQYAEAVTCFRDHIRDDLQNHQVKSGAYVGLAVALGLTDQCEEAEKTLQQYEKLRQDVQAPGENFKVVLVRKYCGALGEATRAKALFAAKEGELGNTTVALAGTRSELAQLRAKLAEKPPARLEVHSEPPGAEVRIDHRDGARDGTTEIAFVRAEMEEGDHTLWLSHPGYAPKSVLASLKAGMNTVLHVELSPEEKPLPRPYLGGFIIKVGVLTNSSAASATGWLAGASGLFPLYHRLQSRHVEAHLVGGFTGLFGQVNGGFAGEVSLDVGARLRVGLPEIPHGIGLTVTYSPSLLIIPSAKSTLDLAPGGVSIQLAAFIQGVFHFGLEYRYVARSGNYDPLQSFDLMLGFGY